METNHLTERTIEQRDVGETPLDVGHDLYELGRRGLAEKPDKKKKLYLITDKGRETMENPPAEWLVAPQGTPSGTPQGTPSGAPSGAPSETPSGPPPRFPSEVSFRGFLLRFPQ